MKSAYYILVLALTMTILTSGTQNRALGQPAPVAPVKKEPSPLQEYVGRYELASGEIPITTIDVTLTKQGLWAKPSLAVKRKLVAQTKTEFLDESENTRYTFTRDPNKKVISLTFEYQGKTYTARKLEVVAPSLTGNVTFQLLRYPDANIVALAGSFNNWNQSQTLCAKEGDRWVCRMKLEPGKYFYKFIVDGDWIADPDNPNTEDDGHGNINSVLVVEPLTKQ